MTDVFSASWEVLQSLNQYGSNVANQIVLHTRIGSKTTLYKALDLLLEEDLIIIDEKKVYTINAVNYEPQARIIKIYDEYQQSADSFDSLFSKLSEKWKNRKPFLDLYSESDKDLIRELITKPPFYELISLIVRLFHIGSLMDFYINSKMLSKTIEKRATSIRRRNEKFVLKFMDLIRRVEPVLWRETLLLIQTRLMTNISP